MMLLLHILSGTRLGAFLAFVIILSIYYSDSGRTILGHIPGMRSFALKKDAERFAFLSELDGNAYQLVLVIVFRFVRDVIRWSLVSIAVLVLYNVVDFLELPLLVNPHIPSLVVLVMLLSPLFGVVLSILWTRQLVVDLTEFASAKKRIAAESLQN